MKKATLKITVRHTTESRPDDEVVYAADGFWREKGQKSFFDAIDDDGTHRKLEFNARKKRRQDAGRMTNILLVFIAQTRNPGAGASVATGFADIEERGYFRDLKEMGGKDAWLFVAVPHPVNKRKYMAFAFFANEQGLQNDEGRISGAGWAIAEGETLAHYHRNISITVRN